MIPRAKGVEHNIVPPRPGSLWMATLGAARKKFEPARRHDRAAQPRRKRRHSCVAVERAALQAALAARRPKLPLIVPNIPACLCFLYGFIKPKSF